MKEEDLRPDACGEEASCCGAVCARYGEIAASIQLQPRLRLGEVSLSCCGEPEFTVCPWACQGCRFTIVQTVRVEIPVTYGMEAQAGEPVLLCLDGPEEEEQVPPPSAGKE